MNVYIKALKEVYAYGPGRTNFTCCAIDEAQGYDDRKHTAARKEYEYLFGFDTFNAVDDNQTKLWSMDDDEMYELRLLLLCMAATVI